MKLSRVLSATVVAAIAALGLCASARAANVIVGPRLTGTWESQPCGAEACTFVNAGPGTSEVSVRSPVDGAIVRWSLVGGSTAGTYRLGTALQFARAGFTLREWDEPVTSSLSAGVQSFPTVLPVEKGMSIALTMSGGASLGFREDKGELVGWGFEPLESENTGEGEVFAEESAGFNAEIQPAPTVTSLGTASGSTAGGTSVTISGTDLENATSVTFGRAPAASYRVVSESQITAVAPANANAGSVTVSATTVAGKATASQRFVYEAPPAQAPTTTPPVTSTPPAVHCVVPNLAGKKLQAAKTALANAKCKLGSVKKLGGATAKSGKVSKQGAKPGSQLSVGSKVAVTLKPAKPAAKKHGGK